MHCEELQIELTAALKAKAARPTAAQMVSAQMGGQPMGGICISAASSGYGPSSASIPTSASSSTVTWAPTISHQDQGSEIDIIMAKIEQVKRKKQRLHFLCRVLYLYCILTSAACEIHYNCFLYNLYRKQIICMGINVVQILNDLSSSKVTLAIKFLSIYADERGCAQNLKQTAVIR